MKTPDKVYTEPKTQQSLPSEIVSELDGSQFEKRSNEAIFLSTVDADGWPHAAQLSVGECLAVSPGELLVAIWPKSHTAENLRRDGRVTMSLVSNGALFEIRAEAKLQAEHQTALDLAVFRIRIKMVREHRSEYADVITGVTFRLHDKEKTFAHWRNQIEMLKQLK
jgi:hypothetical protein